MKLAAKARIRIAFPWYFLLWPPCDKKQAKNVYSHDLNLQLSPELLDHHLYLGIRFMNNKDVIIACSFGYKKFR